MPRRFCRGCIAFQHRRIVQAAVCHLLILGSVQDMAGTDIPEQDPVLMVLMNDISHLRDHLVSQNLQRDRKLTGIDSFEFRGHREPQT